MCVKERTLAMLEARRGNYCSGQEIATKLGVSRNAVWKAIESLRREGYRIQAKKNGGYRLSCDNDILSNQSIERRLQTDFYEIACHKSVTSTNDVLKQAAALGAREGLVAIAEEQTAGKGRRGRAFFSPAGTGIYLSVLLRPQCAAAQSLWITTCAAVAVCEVLERHSKRAMQIKWVNDVFCGQKKVCGILTEACMDMESGGLSYAVLGIGINVLPPENGFPEEIGAIAAPVWTQKEVDRNAVVADVLQMFYQYYSKLEEKAYLQAYRERLMLKGKPVCVQIDGKCKKGLALDVDDDFRLKVRLQDGRVAALSYGELQRIAP